MKRNRTARRLLRAGALAAIALSACTGVAQADPHYSEKGRWITDQRGRVRVLHGFNMVNKIEASGYLPSAVGFGADDARFLARNGFDVVRLGIIWKALEPQPGVYDDSYLSGIERTYETLRKRGVSVLLDFHQDLYNERFQGEGAPDWAVLGQAATEEPDPMAGFPFNYVVQDAVNHAYDAFWANTEVPGTGRGVQDLYAAAWAHVAERFAGKPGILGYNLFNEPWPGTVLQKRLGQGCATSPTSCGVAGFEAHILTPFHRRVVAAIRKVDRRTVVWAAPTLAADFGARSGNGRLDGPAGFAFNAYCGQSQPGIDTVIPFAKGKPCRATAKLSFDNAEAMGERNHQALFMTEFGASDDPATYRDYVAAADRRMVSWTSWSYWNTDVASARPAEGIIRDISRVPTGNNVKRAKLRLLARPFPILTAGTPRRWRWNATSRTFRLAYTPRRAGGGRRFTAGSLTKISVPAIHYANGYKARVSGARVVSVRNARVLRLALCRRATKVTLRLTRGTTGAKARRCS